MQVCTSKRNKKKKYREIEKKKIILRKKKRNRRDQRDLVNSKVEIYLNGHPQLLAAKFQERGRGKKEDDEREDIWWPQIGRKSGEASEQTSIKSRSMIFCTSVCILSLLYGCVSSCTLYMSVLHVAIWNERNKNCSHCRLYNELFNTSTSVTVTAMVSLRYLINVILAFDNIFRSKNLI